MATSAAVDATTKPIRSRAKRACRECNARRVRCNVVEMHPCRNCVAAQASCELVPSRRGRYQRNKEYLPPTDDDRLPSHVDTNEAPDARPHPPDQQHPEAVSQTPPHVASPPTDHQSPIPTAKDTSPTQSTNQVLFFGESNLLTCVVTTERLCYPISDAINIRASELFAEHSSPNSSLKANYLAQEGAFTLAAPQDCLTVLQAYFKWFHPCFPVVDRVEIGKQYTMGEMSLLLLQAILFIGASYCDEDTVHRMGFKDRPEAKSQLYNRTKLLYDADWESNEITILQTLFLTSFWRAGPLNVKNTRYWLGAAITLAQARGFHRS